MKNEQTKKLKLNKLSIAKLDNLEIVKGGSPEGQQDNSFGEGCCSQAGKTITNGEV